MKRPIYQRQSLWLRRALAGTTYSSICATVFATVVAVLDPGGWWPAIAFTSYVLYLTLNHVRVEVEASLPAVRQHLREYIDTTTFGEGRAPDAAWLNSRLHLGPSR